MIDARVQLSTGKWDVITDDVMGLTTYGPAIQVRGDLKPKKKMEITIHETIHASRSDLTEQEVITLSRDILAVLWALGYRSTSLPLRAQPRR